MLHTKENALKILNSLAEECFDKRDYIKAIIYYEKYLELEKNNPDIYNALGYCYRLASDLRENIDLQIENFEKALALNPNHKYALRNLAVVYPYAERYQDAVECFEKLFKIDPVMDDYVTYSYLKIKMKDFETGWKYYEYRFKREYMPTKYPEILKPKWEGEDLTDKTLLVHFEQGFGDTIQFFRYISLVVPLAKKVIFRVQDELLDLCKLNAKGFDVVGVSTPLENLDFDYHTPLMSILNIFDTSVDNIPQTGGYFSADESKIVEYKRRFFDNDCLKVGISWGGMKGGNWRRNLPIECFCRLAKYKKVKLYSFQKGYFADYLKDFPKNVEVVDLGKTFEDFSDTAAAMANLDLFLTSDNCVFNLAGAMGIKTVLLLNKFSEWRWFLDEDKIYWYDSVKLFKKKKESDSWNDLMDKAINYIKLNFDVGELFETVKDLQV